MRGGWVVFAGLLAGCTEPGPLSPAELAPLQACTPADTCVVAKNAPASCDLSSPFEDLVAINDSARGSLASQLENPDCAVVPAELSDAVLANRYAPTCVAGRCTLGEARPHVGDACPDGSCPDGYLCRGQTGSRGDVCFYEPELECVGADVIAPMPPVAPRASDAPWIPYPADAARCASAEGRLDDFACVPVSGVCAADGWPVVSPQADLFVRTGATGGDGSREQPFATIAEAVATATSGDVIALAMGSYAAAPIDVPVSLIGACAAQTVINGGLSVRAPEVRISNVRLTNGAAVEPWGSATFESVYFSGAGLEVLGSAHVAKTLFEAASLHAVLVEGDLEIEQSHVRAASGFGVLATGPAARAVLRDVVVADGSGVDAGGVGAFRGASVDLHRVLVERIDGRAMAIDTGAGTLAQVVCRGGDDGIVVTNRATLIASALRVEDMAANGMVIANAAVRTSSVVFEGFGNDAVLVVEMGELEVTGGRFDSATNAGIEVNGSSVRLSDVVFDGFDGAAIFATDDATVLVDRAQIADARGVGVLVSNGEVELSNTRIVGAGFGVRVVNRGSMDVRQVEVERFRVAAFAVSGVGSTMAGQDLMATEGLGDGAGSFGRGVSVEREATAAVDRVRIDRAREIGVVALGAGSRAALNNLDIRATLPRACARATCPEAPAGIGAGAYDSGRLELSVFEIEAPVACVHAGREGMITARDGRVHDCVVGIAVPIFTSAPNVCFANVETEVQTEMLSELVVGLPD